MRRGAPGQTGLPGDFAGLGIHRHPVPKICRRAGSRVRPRAITRPDIRQRTVQAGKNEIMYGTAIAKPHLVLGGMYVDVHLGRIKLKVQHKRRVAAVIQHVPVGLLHRMRHQPVADDAAVYEEVL